MTPPVPRIKVCGVTRLSDVEMLVAAGVDAIGINWVPSSPRYVSPAQAKVLCELAGQLGLLRVAVLMDPTPRELQSVVEQGQYEFLQFHGMETPDLLLGLQIPRSTVSVSSKGQAVVGPLNLQEPGDSLMPLASTKDLPGEQAGQTPRACLQPGIIKAIAGAVERKKPSWQRPGRHISTLRPWPMHTLFEHSWLTPMRRGRVAVAAKRSIGGCSNRGPHSSWACP